MPFILPTVRIGCSVKHADTNEAFLTANGKDTVDYLTEGICFPADPKARNNFIIKLLYKKISEVNPNPDPSSFRLVQPRMSYFDDSQVVYITYAWVAVFASRELDMEKDIHLTGCDGCSEAIWVGFELAEE